MDTPEKNNSPNGPGLNEEHLSPVRVRRNLILRVSGFILLIALVLGLASWFVVRNEERLEQSIDTNALTIVSTDTLFQVDKGIVSVAYTPPTLGTPDFTMRDEPTRGNQIDPKTMTLASDLLRDASRLLGAQQFDDAEALTLEALNLWPDMNAARRLLGLIYMRRGQFDQATALFEVVLKENPFDPETLNNLATVYIQTKEFERAEELLLAAVGLEPRRVGAAINLGMLYLLQSRYDKATEYLERALDLDPSLTQVRNNLAVALIRQGYFDEARLHLERVIEDEPLQGGAYFNMAITYGMEGNLDQAMAWIQRGSDTCAPAAARKFLSDPDFDNIRETPAFQAFLNTLVPDAPTLPQP